MDGSLVRYLSIDAQDPKHKEIMLSLCKLNDFKWLDVHLRLHGAVVPPGYTMTLSEGILQAIKDIRAAWDMHAILALDSTVTKKNPTGKEKVVGFVLYHINRKTKILLEVLYLIVHKSYRKQGHGWNMMKKCEELHLLLINQKHIPGQLLSSSGDPDKSVVPSQAPGSTPRFGFKFSKAVLFRAPNLTDLYH
jgi:hypothetical protein